jgi:hypothetical protein
MLANVFLLAVLHCSSLRCTAVLQSKSSAYVRREDCAEASEPAARAIFARLGEGVVLAFCVPIPATEV